MKPVYLQHENTTTTTKFLGVRCSMYEKRPLPVLWHVSAAGIIRKQIWTTCRGGAVVSPPLNLFHLSRAPRSPKFTAPVLFSVPICLGFSVENACSYERVSLRPIRKRMLIKAHLDSFIDASSLGQPPRASNTGNAQIIRRDFLYQGKTLN